MTSAIKKAGLFKILSSGRVQGPALKIIAEREKEILKFKPEPYWEIQLTGDIKGARALRDQYVKKGENGKFILQPPLLRPMEKLKQAFNKAKLKSFAIDYKLVFHAAK